MEIVKKNNLKMMKIEENLWSKKTKMAKKE